MKIRFLDRLINVRREEKVAKWHDALAPEITDGLVSKVINEWPGAAVSVPLSILTGNTRAAISAYGTNFSTLRSDSSGTVSFSNLFYNANKANATTFGIARLVFDIASLAGQQIESGSITLSKTASAINSDSAYLYAFTRDTAGTTSANDYDNFGVKLSDMATYNPDTESITFVLNAAGIAYVNAGSVSFMVRDWEDADNITPSEQSNTFQSFSTFAADFYTAAPLLDLTQSNPLYRPQLSVDGRGIISSGESYMSTYLLANKTITQFTCRVWVYLYAVPAYTSQSIDQMLMCNTAFTGGITKGFHFKIQKTATGKVYFRFVFGNGTGVTQGVNSPYLDRSQFLTLYLNRFTSIYCILLNQGVTDYLALYVNGYTVASSSVPSGFFVTPENGQFSIFQNISPATNIVAGNKIFSPYIRTIALSPEEILREYQDDKIKYGF